MEEHTVRFDVMLEGRLSALGSATISEVDKSLSEVFLIPVGFNSRRVQEFLKGHQLNKATLQEAHKTFKEAEGERDKIQRFCKLELVRSSR